MKKLFNFLKLTGAFCLLVTGCSTSTNTEHSSFDSGTLSTSQETTSESSSDKPSSSDVASSSSKSSSSSSKSSSSSSSRSSSSSKSSSNSISSTSSVSSLISSSSSSSTSELKYYTVTWKNYNGDVLEVDTDVLEGSMPEYNGNTPSRDTDDQYIYYFNSWSPELAPVIANAIYTATYTTELRAFTITWVDGNGTTLEVDENVPYGTTPEYNGATPTKASTNQYSYTFTGWSPEITTVTGNATYTAQFSNTLRTYTITWRNGGIIEQDTNVPYGTMPSYDGPTPTKASTSQYTYTFSGWYPDVVTVRGNATYSALFETHTRAFTVTWKDYNGDVLEVDNNVPYGTTPSFDGAEPTREYDNQYCYFFNGWSPAISEVTKDVTYTATYRSEVRTYTITWKNYNGAILETDNNVAYGATPSYDGDTPTRPSTSQYSYTFSGWSPQVASVTSDAVYTAQFNAVVRTYTITWKDYNGDVLEVDNNVPYGAEPVYNGDKPTRESMSGYDYYFTGWSPEITPVTKDATYVATYSSTLKTFTITWQNYNHVVLEIDENVPYGSTPEYNGATPTKPSTSQYTYVFSGWSPAISMVIDHAVYTAQFNQVQRTYTVTWKNYDGTVLETDNNVLYGATPSYDGATPTKPSTAQYNYYFSGWSPSLATVTANATYTAQYDSTVRTYTVTWKNYDGTTLETDNGVSYGTTPTYNGSLPTRAATSSYSYYFSNWSPNVSAVTGNATYTAQYEAVAAFNYSLRSYQYKSGYSASSVNGKPWIDTNYDNEIEKINQPSIKNDFYANVNYDKLVDDEFGPYEKASNYTNSVLSQILSPYGSSTATNAPILRRMFNVIRNASASEVSSYLSSINIDTYVSSKMLFNSSSAFVDLVATTDGGFELKYNDGYIDNRQSTLQSLVFWNAYYPETYGTAARGVIQELSSILSLGFSSTDIDNIFEYGGTKLAKQAWNMKSQKAYSNFTVNNVPWNSVKSALLDLGLSSNTSIKVTAGNISVLNSLFNDYLVNNKTIMSNYLKARLAFDYRYLLGYTNYRSLNAYYKSLSIFSGESTYANLDDDVLDNYFTQTTLREVLENCYLEDTASAGWKTVTSQLIVKCINEYKLLIQENNWLDSSTKEAALRKLNNMKYESLFSDTFFNMGAINVPNLNSASAFAIMRAVENHRLTLAGQHMIENDANTWATYHSYTVNGFYLPARNVFLIFNALTSGGLMGYSTSTTYALIGSIIAHEISHAFDGNGANYDETGASADWWSNNDKLEFQAKVQKVYEFFDGIYMDQTNKVTGSKVGNEAIADMGAIRVMLRLGAKANDFDAEEFFKAYAGLWHHARLSGAFYTTRINDSHPMSYLRCNVTLAQFDEFYTTFGITSGDGMYIPPANRVAIW